MQSREDEAASALPHTRFGRGAAPLLVVGFLLSLASVPLWERFGPPSEPEEAAPTVLNATTPKEKQPKEKSFRLLQGNATVPEEADFKRLETHLEDSSNVWKKARPGVQSLLAQHGGQGNAQVVVGQDGWLFYRQSVDHLTELPFLHPLHQERRKAVRNTHPDAVPAISNFANQLRARGIRLIVMPVPVKATIYPDKLWAGYDPLQGPPQNPSMDTFKRKLELRGVPVFDPTETLWRARYQRKRLQFFPGDTHWTPQGAAIVGQALGDFVRMWGELPDRAREEFTTHDGGDAQATDLVRLLGLPAENTLYPPVLQPAVRVNDPQGKIANSRRDGDVLLLGDSFGGSYADTGAGLGAHLMASLGRPVDVLTVPNGGSWAVRAKLREQMLDGDDRLAGKKVVVYEFIARDLSYGNWTPFKLPTEAEIARIREKLGPKAPPLAIVSAEARPQLKPPSDVAPPVSAPSAPVATAPPSSTAPPATTPQPRLAPTRSSTPAPTATATPAPKNVLALARARANAQRVARQRFLARRYAARRRAARARALFLARRRIRNRSVPRATPRIKAENAASSRERPRQARSRRDD